MKASDFEFLADFLIKDSGLALQPEKEYLLNSRLIPVAEAAGLDGIEGLVEELRRGAGQQLRTAVTEAMTTNETLFFRDKTPFEELKDVLLPALIPARADARRLRIWCTAASSGQEPYTIAMILHDFFPQLGCWDIEILATDISRDILKQAEDGEYSQFEVQRGLPIQSLVEHFDQSGTRWRIKDHLRQRIQFRHQNLLSGFGHLGEFDVVFCRNVLIYFDTETKRDVLERTRRVIADDGYLLLGAAETVMGVTKQFERYRDCKSGVYRPADVRPRATGTHNARRVAATT
ncbi:MAG: CheR family methyltransferase [Planctomycetaceae bacterium]